MYIYIYIYILQNLPAIIISKNCDAYKQYASNDNCKVIRIVPYNIGGLRFKNRKITYFYESALMQFIKLTENSCRRLSM